MHTFQAAVEQSLVIVYSAWRQDRFPSAGFIMCSHLLLAESHTQHVGAEAV